MKKLFTLMAAALFAVSANAEDYTVTADCTGEVQMENLKITFLNNTSKGSTADAGTWAFNEGEAKADQNSCEIKFEPTVSGKLTIYFAAKLADNKPVVMFVNGNTGNTLSCTRLADGSTIESGGAHEELAKGEGICYTILSGNTYNFYGSGTKYAVSGFSYEADPSLGEGGNEGNTGGDEGNTGGEALGARTWNFTQWSEATIANLKADANWTDDEKDNGVTVDSNCFWAISTQTENGSLLANGQVIEELKGLVFAEKEGDRALAIAVNYPEAMITQGDPSTTQTYHGPKYLWLGGKNKQYFTIPAVAGGSTIKMGIESHKNTDARGVDLLVNGSSIGKFTPTTYEETVFDVPAGETVDVVVDNTNGCHIYFIEVADATSIQEVVKVINNGAVYNLAGQKVDGNYKGVVIKNGKKFVQK